MRCFAHQEQDAVGVCKSCQKGLCRECALDLGKGLACRASCEDDVRRLIQLIESNMRLAPIGTKVWLGHSTNLIWTAVACIVLGLLLTIWGSFDLSRFAIVAVMGAVLLAWGILQAVQALRVRAVTQASGQARE